MSERKLTAEQLEELQSGDGYYYVSQGMAGHAGEWPSVVDHPKDRMLRLVRRQAKEVQSKGEAHANRRN